MLGKRQPEVYEALKDFIWLLISDFQ